jgi:hypothetical protein
MFSVQLVEDPEGAQLSTYFSLFLKERRETQVFSF